MPAGKPKRRKSAADPTRSSIYTATSRTNGEYWAEQIAAAEKRPTPAERLNRVFSPKITAEVAEGLKAMQGKAKGRQRHKPGEMNKTEQAYADELDSQKREGVILWWSFEAVKLKLAPLTFYTPDFLVMHADLSLEFVETKGRWEDDARVKIKCAAEKFSMFKFSALKPKRKRDGGGWEREEF